MKNAMATVPRTAKSTFDRKDPTDMHRKAYSLVKKEHMLRDQIDRQKKLAAMEKYMTGDRQDNATPDMFKSLNKFNLSQPTDPRMTQKEFHSRAISLGRPRPMKLDT